MRFRQTFLVSALLVFLCTWLTGCASARMSDTESDSLFRRGQYDAAAQRLEKGLVDQGENGRDLLLYLLDIGLSLHSAGKYEESIKYLLRADKIAEIKDYTSLTREGATLLTSDNIKDYKGEDFEKVLINTYLSMNYALLGNYEDALVEARRVNQKLYRMVSEGARKYKQNAFARYLSAVSYEAQGDLNDAYVDYKETYKLDSSYPQLGRDLWRMARLSSDREDMDKWDETFKLTDEDHKQAMLFSPRSGKGEIVVLYENGISPIKRPNPYFNELPKFYPRRNPVTHARVDVFGAAEGGPKPAADAQAPVAFQAETAMLENIEATAIQNLDEKYAGLIAKKVAGIVVKEVVSHEVGRRTDPLVGQALRLLLYLSDQADVRSWNLLPHDLQIARIPVEPGAYTVRVTPLGMGGSLPEKTVRVAKGKRVFVDFRYVP
jgi:uncharacterized protein